MKTKIKTTAALLAALLAAAAAAGCGESTGTPAVSGETASVGTTAEVTEAEPEVINWESANLPVVDYGGADFYILNQHFAGYDGSWYKVNAAEIDGEVLNDAVFNRNRKIESIYNIKFDTLESADVKRLLNNSIQANEDAFDAVHGKIDELYTIAQIGGLVNWYDLPHVDLKKPWWDDSVIRDLSYHEKLYFCTGDISPTTDVRVFVMVFNKDLCRSLDLEMPYRYVLDGTWTMDIFNRYISDVNADLNGDGVMDYEDRWGYLSQNGNSFMMYFSGGGRVVDLDQNGDYQLVFDSARNIDLAMKAISISIDKTKTLMADPYVAQQGSWAAVSSWFAGGNALFRISALEPVPRDYRSMDTDFGIVPCPKADAEQKDYVTLPEYYSIMYAVPTTADADYSGLILESLAAESVSTVSPAFYDACLNGKSVRDEESSAMLDIIFANKHFDIGLTCEIGGFRTNIQSLEAQQSTDAASSFAAIKSKAQTALDKLTEQLDKVN